MLLGATPTNLVSLDSAQAALKRLRVAGGGGVSRGASKGKERVEEEDDDGDEISLLFLEALTFAVSKQGTRVKKSLDWFESLLGAVAAEGDDESVGAARNLLADACWLLGTVHAPASADSSTDNAGGSEEWAALCSVVRGFAGKGASNGPQIVPLSTLLTVLEESLLEGAGLLEDVKKFARGLKKMNTDRVYKQRKFNLMREESEGYGKVVCLFSALTLRNVDYTVNQVKGLIGYFDLDPNRVFDLALDALQMESSDSNVPAHVALISSFDKSSVPHLIGFKLTAAHSENKDCPDSLLKAVALLMKHDVVKYEQILPYVDSDLQEILDASNEAVKAFAQQVKKLGIISLNASSSEAESAESGGRSASGSPVPRKAPVPAGFTRLRIISALISVNAYVIAKEMMDYLSEFGIDCLILCPSIGSNLCKLLRTVVEPAYASIAPPRFAGPVARAPCLHLDVNDNSLPPVTSTENLVDAIAPVLALISHSGAIAAEPVLYAKLCRIVAYAMKNHESSRGKCVEVLTKVLVPTISLMGANPAMSSELWNCLEILPYEERYKIYDAWKGLNLERKALGTKALMGKGNDPECDKSLYLAQAEVKTGLAARAAMKRLSKDNYVEMGKQLAKAVHSNPIVVFSVILGQIESYDNMISLIVDSFKFLTPLSLDVLSHQLLSAMSANERVKLKSDGINASNWLAALEQFVGALYAKHPTVELRGILRYVIERLTQQSVLELGVLNSLLTKAGGLQVIEGAMSSAQLQGRAGGKILKRETTNFGIVDKVDRKAAGILRSILSEKDIGLPLLVLASQVRSHIIFNTETESLKFIGNLYDTTTKTLLLLVEFMSTAPEEADASASCVRTYGSLFSSLLELVSKEERGYGLDPDVAFSVVRPLVTSALLSQEMREKKMAAIEEGADVDEELVKVGEEEKKIAEWLPSKDAMRSTYKVMLPGSAWEALSVQLYETFWSLKLYDIYVPKQKYEEEVDRLKKECVRLQSSWKDDSTKKTTSSQKKYTSMKNTMTELKKEMTTQQSHCRAIRRKVEATKDDFLGGLDASEVINNSSQAFLTHCVFPRSLLSTEDASFSAKFILMLHSMEAPHFPTLQFLDKLLKSMVGMLFCVTEGEAVGLGVLFRELWTQLRRWRYNEKIYAEEAMNKASFKAGGVALSHSKYCSMYDKWHEKVAHVCRNGMRSKEYIHIRATLVVLSEIVKVFPSHFEGGKMLEEEAEKLREGEEERPDLKAMAIAYFAQLQVTRKSGAWMDNEGEVWKGGSKVAAKGKRNKAAGEKNARVRWESSP